MAARGPSSCSLAAAPLLLAPPTPRPRPRPRPSSSSSRCCCCCLLLRIPNTNRLLHTPANIVVVNANKRQMLPRPRPRRHSALLAPPPPALPEAAAVSVLVAGLVGVAATLLLGKAPADDDSSSSQQQQQQQDQQEECSDCGGTGLCPRCKGEGFVFKKLSDETASKARKAAKNMATRYTAGLPTKWTYCNRCSSTRSCTTCGGSGRTRTTVTTT